MKPSHVAVLRFHLHIQTPDWSAFGGSHGCTYRRRCIVALTCHSLPPCCIVLSYSGKQDVVQASRCRACQRRLFEAETASRQSLRIWMASRQGPACLPKASQGALGGLHPTHRATQRGSAAGRRACAAPHPPAHIRRCPPASSELSQASVSSVITQLCLHLGSPRLAEDEAHARCIMLTACQQAVRSVLHRAICRFCSSPALVTCLQVSRHTRSPAHELRRPLLHALKLSAHVV